MNHKRMARQICHACFTVGPENSLHNFTNRHIA